MEDYEATLKKYIESLLSKREEIRPRTIRNWIFGAINFAFSAKLINIITYDRLLKEYGLIATEENA